MKILALFRDIKEFAVMEMNREGVQQIVASGIFAEIDALRKPEYRWLLPVAVEDRGEHRRPEPGEHVVDLALRMLEESQFDYSAYKRSSLVLCVHGEAA